MKRGPYTPRDERLCVEYVRDTYPNAIAVFYQLPLGPADEELKKMYPGYPDTYYKRWKPRCDGVVVLEDAIVAIEAKTFYARQGLGDLLSYRDKIPETPELHEWKDLPVRLELVTPREDRLVIRDAVNFGIHYVLYRPEWAVQYLMERSAKRR